MIAVLSIWGTIYGRSAYCYVFPLPSGLEGKYVGNQACAQCHEKFYKRWSLSYHAKSMDHANSESVLGNFNDARLEHFGTQSRFFMRNNNQYWVQTDVPIGETISNRSSQSPRSANDTSISPSPVRSTGQQKEFQVKYVLGFFPLQQYLVEFPDGKIQCLPLAWNVAGKKWFHLYSNEAIPEGDILHWRQPTQNWNYMCAGCHVTNLNRGYNLADNSYHSTFTEINNGCESCHGPGSIHIQIANRNKKTACDRRYGCGLFTYKGAKGPQSTDSCAPCHARRVEIYPNYLPGEKFCDYFFPELLDTDAFYPDGQIKEEDFEYTSFLQSKFYALGGSCADCHDTFIARVKHLQSDGYRPEPVSKMCAKCHEDKKYNSENHHFHKLPANSAGTRCEDCHMPATNYMSVDNRRDHSMSIPRPQLSVDLGVPNACSGCHNKAGQTPQWAQEKIDSWYGKQDYSSHFAYTIDAGRKQKPEAAPALIKLLAPSDKSSPDSPHFTPDIVRASAAALLTNYTSSLIKKALLDGLKDKSELVRTSCVRALEFKFDSTEELRNSLVPLLSDSVRSVRTEAARQLSAVFQSPQFTDYKNQEYQAFDKAIKEYITGLDNLNDQPASYLNKAVLEENKGDLTKAEAFYRDALKINPTFYPAQNNLAMVLYKQNKIDAALKEFQAITQQHPDNPEGWYSLGLLLAEMTPTVQTTDSSGLSDSPNEFLISAADCFLKASQLPTTNARIFYNLGLTSLKLKRYQTAEKALQESIRREPNNRDFINAMIYFYRQTNNPEKEQLWQQYQRKTSNNYSP